MTGGPVRPPVSARRATIAAISVTALAMFPVWLLGAMAADVQRDLGFGPAALGAAVAVFQAVSALTSIPSGLLVERTGFRRGSLATVGLFVVATLGIATVATGWRSLAVFLAVAAVASALSSPTVNLGLARLIAPGQQGFAFGLKQAAVPAGTFVAGLAVPLIALTIGWRWAFGIAACAAIPLALTVPRDGRPVTRRADVAPAPREKLRPLLILAAAAGLGTAATNAMGVFFVVSAIDRGIAAGVAGLTLSLGGLVSVGARILTGWLADRRGRHHFPVVAGMMAVGALGMVGLAVADDVGWLILATIVAYGLGWSWNGLYDFALVRRMPERPATATGIAQTGKYLGGVAGPWLFGVTVEISGFRTAWLGAAAVLLAGGALTLWGRARLRAVLAAAASPP
jgi:MFS family permease